MMHIRIEMKKKSLLDAGYPRLDYCEVDGGKVVRRVQTWNDGRSVKQTLDGASEWRRQKGLRETVPDLTWKDSQQDAAVQEITKGEFDKVWADAELVGDEWG